VTQTATKQQPEAQLPLVAGEASLPETPLDDSREWQADQLRLLWGDAGCFSELEPSVSSFRL